MDRTVDELLDSMEKRAEIRERIRPTPDRIARDLRDAIDTIVKLRGKLEELTEDWP